MAKRRWSDLTPTQKRLVGIGVALEVVTTAAALRDLVRRPADAVRGPKPLWVVSMAVQPFGPLAYLAYGRRG